MNHVMKMASRVRRHIVKQLVVQGPGRSQYRSQNHGVHFVQDHPSIGLLLMLRSCHTFAWHS
jgi:hypothetical protein